MKKSLLLTVSALLVIFFSSEIFAQSDSIVWNLTTSPGSGIVASGDATIIPSNVVKGANLDGTSVFNANGFGTAGNASPGWDESDTNAAISNNAFVEFSFQLACGRNFDLDSLSFFARTSSGSAITNPANNSSIRVSIDGSAFNPITPISTFPSNVTSASEVALKFNLNPNITLIQGQTISFRIFASNIGANIDTLYIRNFVIKGIKSTGAITGSAGSSTSICFGNSTNISITNISGGTSPYDVDWNNGATDCANVLNSCSATVSPATSTTYVAVVTDNNGCTGSFSQSITIKPLPTISPVSNNGPICAGSNLNLTCNPGAGNGNFTFQWAGPGGFSSTLQNPTIPNAPAGASGTYTVTVTSDGCVTTGTTNVTVKALPTITPVNSNSPLCVGQTLNLTSTPGGGNGTFTFQWVGPNTFTSSLEDPSITNVTTAIGGLYSVTVTSNGCTTSGSTNVTVNTLPTISPVSNSGPVCAGQTLNLFSAPAGGNGSFTFLWSGPNSFTSSQEDPSITNVTIGASGIYTVTVTSNNCSATATTNATVNQGPLISPVNNNGPICEGETLLLSCVPSGGNGTFAFQWSGPGSFSSSLEDPSISGATVANNGTYTVSVTSNGCTTTGTTTANVKALPTIIPVSNNGPICAGITLQLNSNPGAGNGTFTFQWVGPNAFSSTQEDPNITNATTAASGIYTVTVTSNGCTATGNTSALVNTLPTITPISSNSPVCEGSTLTLFSSPGAGNGTFTFQWTGPNGFSSTLEDPSITNVQATSNGTYTVTVSSNSCSATGTTPVVVNIPSIAPSSINATDTIFCNGESATLTLQGGALGTNAKFKWYLNSCGGGAAIDSSNSITISPINNGSTPISQEFFVRAENTQSPCTANTGCASRTITVNPIPTRINLFPDTICSGTALDDNVIASFTNGVTYSWFTSGPSIVTGNQSQFPATSNSFKPETLFNLTTNQQPSVTYTDTLIFTNVIRCLSFVTNTVVVNPAAPKAQVTDLTSVSGSIPTSLCGGTEFNSFNVTNGFGGINYEWLTSPPSVIVHEPDSLNTVITFPDSSSSYIATIMATSINQISLGGCPNDSTVFTVEISSGDQIQEAPIILKQPGNLLVYLDNTAFGYQWGFDSKNTFAPSKITGQVYQTLDHPAVLPFDTTSRNYWVLVYKNDCVTKVYYNGPYSSSKGSTPEIIPDEVSALVYPNPTNGIFDLVVSGNIYQNVYFKIINHIGQVVHAQTLYKDQPLQNYKVDIPSLAKGLYLVEIRGDYNEQATYKIVIK